MARTTATNSVLVGVDGTRDGLHAVDYAAADVVRAGGSLLLQHVPVPLPAIYTFPAGEESLERAAERAVETARSHAEDRGVPPSEIRVRVSKGHVVPTLVDASKHARLVVLGRRGLSGLERRIAGSTTVSVGARAACPVVAVPHAWTPNGHRGRVVVGLDGSARSLPALALAVTEATARSAELVAVRAWEPPAPYYLDVPELAETLHNWSEAAARELAETLAGWSEEHPDLTITRVLERKYAVAALISHSADADLLVVGARGRGGLQGLLGTVARGVVAGSSCPVMLVRRGPRTPAGVKKHRTRKRTQPADLVTPVF